MISTAEAVVIGAGSFGSSLAYHLAKMGLSDVVLLDRFEVGAPDLAARGRADATDPAGAGDDASRQAQRGEAGRLHRGDGHSAGVPSVGQRQDGAGRRRRGPGRVGDPRGSAAGTRHSPHRPGRARRARAVGPHRGRAGDVDHPQRSLSRAAPGAAGLHRGGASAGGHRSHRDARHRPANGRAAAAGSPG